MAVKEAGRAESDMTWTSHVSTLIYKKPFSFKWTLDDTEANSMFQKKKSPCFSVLLQPPTPSQPELNSLWHLLLWKNDLFLCQGWHTNDLYANYVPPEKGSMYIQECCFYVSDHRNLLLKKYTER